MKKGMYAAALLALALGAHAEGLSSGSWQVVGGVNGVPPIALTLNDSGNAYGQVCSNDAEACFWMILSPKTPCKDGDRAPLLANSATGSFSFTAECVGVYELEGKKYHRYVLSPFDDATTMTTTSSGILSFAMPINGGSFTVMRFDLTGSAKVIRRLDELKIKFFNKINSRSTKDFSL